MALKNNILSIIRGAPPDTADSLLQAVAQRVRARRLARNATQQAFATTAGIPLATYRRFERTGELSLRGLAKLALALGEGAQLKGLFQNAQYADLNEMLAAKSPRKRGRSHG